MNISRSIVLAVALAWCATAPALAQNFRPSSRR